MNRSRVRLQFGWYSLVLATTVGLGIGIEFSSLRAAERSPAIPLSQSTGNGLTQFASTLPVEIVAEVTQAPGNITVTPDGRIIISLHQFYQTRDRVVEVKPDGSLVPFPDVSWAQGRKPDGTGLDTVLGIQADAEGVVWMLDNGMRGGVTPQLVGWNTRTDVLEKVIPLPAPVTSSDSFLNDLAVDLTHGAVYIADTSSPEGRPALIVVDLATGQARRVLVNHQSVLPEAVPLKIEGQIVKSLQPDGTTVEPKVAVNPIALDATDEWLYYGPMHGTRLYRVRTEDLLNTRLSAEQLAQSVEDYAARPISDGISTDAAGNIYITDISANTIGVIQPDRSYRPLVSEAWMSWPDALSFGPDGYLYSVVNQLHRTPALNGGVDATEPPFTIFRFRPLADGIVGR
ncbi:MAG: L-dopachrome tautomerase-related protein [Microcoleaceae cyanobacterium]